MTELTVTLPDGLKNAIERMHAVPGLSMTLGEIQEEIRAARAEHRDRVLAQAGR